MFENNLTMIEIANSELTVKSFKQHLFEKINLVPCGKAIT